MNLANDYYTDSIDYILEDLPRDKRDFILDILDELEYTKEQLDKGGYYNPDGHTYDDEYKSTICELEKEMKEKDKQISELNAKLKEARESERLTREMIKGMTRRTLII